MDLNILAILSIAFSPIVGGLAVLVYIKNKQTKEISKKPKGTLQEIFGLES